MAALGVDIVESPVHYVSKPLSSDTSHPAFREMGIVGYKWLKCLACPTRRRAPNE